MNMSSIPKEQLRNMPFAFQKCMLDSPRVLPAELGRKSGVSRYTAKKYLNKFLEQKILHPPQMRLKPCNQIAEIVYLLKVTDTEAFIPILEAEKYIFYYCLLGGPYNLIFMSYKPIDFSHLKGYKQTMVSGIRSRYYVPSIVNRTYESGYKRIMDRCNRKIEPSLFDNKIEDFVWTDDLWELYCDLKYNLRMDFTPLVKKHGFKSSSFYDKVKQLLAYCDTFVPLYPLSEDKYTFFYFLFKTKYQKFIVESFGELPVFSTHLRVKDYLLSNVPVLHEEERDFFRKVISVWQQRGLIDSYDLSVAYWSDRINNYPGMPPPPPLPLPPRGNIPPVNGDSDTGKGCTSFM